MENEFRNIGDSDNSDEIVYQSEGLTKTLEQQPLGSCEISAFLGIDEINAKAALNNYRNAKIDKRKENLQEVFFIINYFSSKGKDEVSLRYDNGITIPSDGTWNPEGCIFNAFRWKTVDTTIWVNEEEKLVVGYNFKFTDRSGGIHLDRADYLYLEALGFKIKSYTDEWRSKYDVISAEDPFFDEYGKYSICW